MSWKRTIVVAAVLAVVSLAGVRIALAIAGDLDEPSLSIPAPDGKQDPVGSGMYKVLMKYKDEFVDGTFINAHTRMNFRGTTKKFNAMMRDLSHVEGSETHVKFSKEEGASDKPFTQKEGEPKPSQWCVDHDGWFSPNRLSITVFIGDDSMNLEEIYLPTIRGRAPKAEAVQPAAEKPEK